LGENPNLLYLLHLSKIFFNYNKLFYKQKDEIYFFDIYKPKFKLCLVKILHQTKEKNMKKNILVMLSLLSILSAQEIDGERVFKTYCWGCHHQTAEAFGPSFSQIAKKRTFDEIQAYILSPESMYISFGYKRTAMSKIDLSDKEREAVSKYLLSYKGK
jgi:cytochrome c551/c552